MCTVATTVPKLHWWSPMEPIWRLRWSGDDEVDATGGHVDQQLEDDDGHLLILIYNGLEKATNVHTNTSTSTVLYWYSI